jgi:transcriptional regulator GlxA family with amidase domain
MEAAGNVLEGDRESAQAHVVRALAMLHGEQVSRTPLETPLHAPLRTPPSPAGRDGTARGGLAPWQVRRVTDYIEAHLATTIRLEELARLARLSHSHFCRAFKESLGHPAHAFVMRRRVQRAQGLMLTTGESLSQIAAQCGMADQAHFCKLFRRLVGESPNAWRRARRSRDDAHIDRARAAHIDK